MRHLNEAFEIDVLKPSQDAPARVSPVRRLLFLGRQKWVVLLCTLLMSALGAVYVLQKSATYTAHGLLLVENTQLDPGRAELVPSMGIVDTSMVDTQVEIIKSETIALKVIEALKLAEEEAQSRRPGWLATLKNSLLPIGENSEVDDHPSPRTTLPAFDQNLYAKRIGTTYTIDIRFTARNPEMAARVTNEVIKAYLADQAAAGVASASAASAWLRERIKDLGPKTRVLNFAAPPLKPDGPGRLRLLSAFVALGILSGLGLAVARVMLDSSLKDPLEAEFKLGANFIGAVTKFSHRANSKHTKIGQDGPREGQSQLVPVLEVPPFMRSALDLPESDLASTLGRARAALARAGRPSVVGVTSLTSGQGVTTIAGNLAMSAAAAGSRVLLIDGNSYQPDLSRHLGRNSEAGLGDVIAGKATLQDVRRQHRETELYFLPWAGQDLANHYQHRRTELAALVRSWKDDYDLVILDLPPLLPTADVAFVKAFVDSLLIVVQWGCVSSALMQSALSASDISGDNLLGFVFNKVPSSAIRQSTFPVEAYLKRYKRRRTTVTEPTY